MSIFVSLELLKEMDLLLDAHYLQIVTTGEDTNSLIRSSAQTQYKKLYTQKYAILSEVYTWNYLII